MKRILALLALVSSPALAQSYPGQYSTTPPTLADGQNSPLQVDSNGNLKISTNAAGQWTYTSGTTGILSNTTVAVTVKANAGAGLRNFISSCQVSTTAFTTSVPLALRDGAGGAVIWAAQVPAAGFLTPVTINFTIPLRSTANTLIEVVTTTANTTGTAMVNCQGFTGP